MVHLESDKKSENVEPDAGSNTGSEGDEDHSGLEPMVFHLPMLSSIEWISYTECIEYTVTSLSWERRNISEEVCSCVRGLRGTRNTPNKSLTGINKCILGPHNSFSSVSHSSLQVFAGLKTRRIGLSDQTYASTSFVIAQLSSQKDM